MRILIIVTLLFSVSAFAQRVKENVKQQTMTNGTKAVINDFEITPVKEPVPVKPKL